jgi:hypothetical protein
LCIEFAGERFAFELKRSGKSALKQRTISRLFTKAEPFSWLVSDFQSCFFPSKPSDLDVLLGRKAKSEGLDSMPNLKVWTESQI